MHAAASPFPPISRVSGCLSSESPMEMEMQTAHATPAHSKTCLFEIWRLTLPRFDLEPAMADCQAVKFGLPEFGLPDFGPAKFSAKCLEL